MDNIILCGNGGYDQELFAKQNHAYDINGNDPVYKNIDLMSKSLFGLNLEKEGEQRMDTMKKRNRLRAELRSLTQPLELSQPPSALYEQNIYLQLLARQTQEQYEMNMTYSNNCQQPARREKRAYMWSGELPPRNYSHPVFSCKIFVGGVPWDVTEDALLEAFGPYGKCKVEWPGNEARFSRSGPQHRGSTRGKVTGYVYMIFDNEHSVRHLLRDCSQEFGSAGEWYFRLKAKRNNTIETRQVQIIPWVVSDASYVEDPGARLDGKKTVFVGALHGMITAHVLFSIMNELYGKVVFVGIDTDKYKYPIGSGRVTFSSHSSYFRAIECAFLEIKTSKFSKRVQIDPFLEESECMICHQTIGPFFCRDRTCFRYHCACCWEDRHAPGSINASHRYLTRNTPRVNRDPIELSPSSQYP